jgi:hypothetical protein
MLKGHPTKNPNTFGAQTAIEPAHAIENTTGIWFEMNNEKHFAPHAMLSCIDLTSEKAIFRYADRTIIVRGKRLDELCELISRGSLAFLRQNADRAVEASGATIKEITIEMVDARDANIPFP